MDMRKTGAKSGQKEPRTRKADSPTGRRSFEWPLLIYPVLFLGTLAILCLVNHSIQEEPLPPVGPHQAAEQPAVTPEDTGHPEAVVGTTSGRPGEFVSGPGRRFQTSAEAAPDYVSPDTPPRHGSVTSTSGRASSIVGKMQHAVDLSQLQGPARTVAILRIAVDEKDPARIKQCLAELVGLGDEAVVPLNDLLANEGGDTALWAATALARIGTPTATSALLDRLAETKEGLYKEELSKRIASISNHDSWPLLLDTMMQTGDTTVARAAGTSLSMMADAPVIDEVIARYDAASTDVEVERLTQLVRNIRSPQAAEPLLSLAGPVSAAPQDTLQEAAIEALARVGDAPSVSYLLRRLEASPPGESTQIFNAITQIDNPDAQASLLYAAAGNKEVSAEHGRTAAIYALKNFPDEKTMILLERIIAQEQNEKVLTAAARTLDDIRMAPHAIAAKAGSLLQSEQMLPLPPVEK
jgi:HEAT repeat protein